MEADLRYPIGKPERPEQLTEEQRRAYIAAIAETPAKLRAAVAGLNQQQLDTPYRPGGWTVRQVVHHLPDSHMNAYVRFKLALTENEPTIKPYQEAAWANLPDSKGPIEPSLALLDSLHQRWIELLGTLGPARLGEEVQSSGERTQYARQVARHLRLAWAASRGAHHGAAGAQRLAVDRLENGKEKMEIGKAAVDFARQTRGAWVSSHFQFSVFFPSYCL